MEIFIPSGRKQRNIGRIQDGIFMKRVDKKVHLFQNLDSWGIDLVKFNEVVAKFAKTGIQIFDKEEKIYYRTTVAVFQRFGIIQDDYKGHRKQIFLPRNYFTQLKSSNGLQFKIIQEPVEKISKFMHPENFRELNLTF